MDAKNAALALCQRLKPAPRPAVRPVSAAAPPPPPPAETLPREVFLPAIDPTPYTQALAPAKSETPPEPFLPPPRSAPPADRLQPLRWPRGFESLKRYFENTLPETLFDLPGWRFVRAAPGLWIGMQQQDGRVCGVAYAHRGDTPPSPGKGYRPLRGTDGQMYQVLWQKP